MSLTLPTSNVDASFTSGLAQMPAMIAGALFQAGEQVLSIPLCWGKAVHPERFNSKPGISALPGFGVKQQVTGSAPMNEPIYLWIMGFYHDNLQISQDLWRAIAQVDGPEAVKSLGYVGQLTAEYHAFQSVASDHSITGTTRDAAKVAMDAIKTAWRRSSSLGLA